MALLVKCPTLGFDSGRDLTVGWFEPWVGLRADGAEPAWGFLSLSLSPSLSALLTLSPSKINKYKLKKKIRKLSPV